MTHLEALEEMERRSKSKVKKFTLLIVGVLFLAIIAGIFGNDYATILVLDCIVTVILISVLFYHLQKEVHNILYTKKLKDI